MLKDTGQTSISPQKIPRFWFAISTWIPQCQHWLCSFLHIPPHCRGKIWLVPATSFQENSYQAQGCCQNKGIGGPSSFLLWPWCYHSVLEKCQPWAGIWHRTLLLLLTSVSQGLRAHREMQVTNHDHQLMYLPFKHAHIEQHQISCWRTVWTETNSNKLI